MIEVEVKAKIKDFETIRPKLIELGAIKIKDEFQEDTYFSSSIKDFAKTDEALRIRKVIITNSNNNIINNNKIEKVSNDSEFDNIFITYKGPKIDKNSKTRKEVEVGVEDSSKVAEIFEELGFSSVAKVVKDREIFEINNGNYSSNKFIISFDDVKDLGPYMEIETDLNDGEDFQIALNNIFNLYNDLGIIDDFERTSYLELLENKNNK